MSSFFLLQQRPACLVRLIWMVLEIGGKWPCRSHRRASLMSSSLLLQQCLTCLVRLIWMVLEMEGKGAYSCCFMGCCFQDSFNMTRNILAFSRWVLSGTTWNIHSVILTQSLLGRNPVFNHRIDQTSKWSITYW